MQKFVEQIIKQVAEKHGLSEKALTLLFDSQFRLIREKIKTSDETNEYPVVMLPKFGKFAPSPKKVMVYRNVDITQRFPKLYPKQTEFMNKIKPKEDSDSNDDVK